MRTGHGVCVRGAPEIRVYAFVYVIRYGCKCGLMIFRWDFAFPFMTTDDNNNNNNATVRQWAVTFGLTLFWLYIHSFHAPIHLFIITLTLTHIQNTPNSRRVFFSSSSCHSQRYIINATEICRENISFSMYSVLWIIIWCVRAFWSIFASVTVNCDVSI